MPHAEGRRAQRAKERRAQNAGFTLLEVLAAVAVLAFVFTALATAGVQGLRAEGNADRRLRAGLLADDRLTLLEAQLLAGLAVPIGDSEESVDEFTLKVSVTPLDLTLPKVPEKLADRARDRVRAANDLRAAGPVAAAAAAAGAAAAGQPAGSFFAPAAAGQPPPGRRILVTATFDDGVQTLEVRRETLGLDQQAAAGLLEALDAAAEEDREARDQKADAGKKKPAQAGAEADAGAAPQKGSPAPPPAPTPARRAP